jgi:hypothetical protein
MPKRKKGGLPTFKGKIYIPTYQQQQRQRGFGLFGSLFRALAPIGKSFLKAAGKDLITDGAAGLQDVLSGRKSVKGAVRQTIKKQGKNFMKNAAAATKRGGRKKKTKKGGTKRKTKKGGAKRKSKKSSKKKKGGNLKVKINKKKVGLQVKAKKTKRKQKSKTSSESGDIFGKI